MHGHNARYHAMGATVTKIRSKTEQRIGTLLSVMQDADRPLSYEELRRATGASGETNSTLRGGIPPDALLYILAAWEAVGMVTKSEGPPTTKGACRPRFLFSWVGDRVLGVPQAVLA